MKAANKSLTWTASICDDVVGESGEEEVAEENSSLHVQRVLNVRPGADPRVQGTESQTQLHRRRAR